MLNYADCDSGQILSDWKEGLFFFFNLLISYIRLTPIKTIWTEMTIKGTFWVQLGWILNLCSKLKVNPKFLFSILLDSRHIIIYEIFQSANFKRAQQRNGRCWKNIWNSYYKNEPAYLKVNNSILDRTFKTFQHCLGCCWILSLFKAVSDWYPSTLIKAVALNITRCEVCLNQWLYKKNPRLLVLGKMLMDFINEEPYNTESMSTESGWFRLH